MTEGILTRQLLADPFLETVGAVVLDEFHERNLHTDLALALLREVRDEVRPDLDPGRDVGHARRRARSREFLGGCPVVVAEGRTASRSPSSTGRPIDRRARRRWLPIVQQWLDDPARAGHLLVFLPGMAEIRRASSRLEPMADAAGAVVLPLHGSLGPDEQDRALRPSDRRKIILSTNIAETSLTIDGRPHGDRQRAGARRPLRPGARDRPLVAEPDQPGLGRSAGGPRGPDRARAAASGSGPSARTAAWPAFEEPEIHRVDLCGTVLALHSWGMSDPTRFGWFEPPDADRLAAAERLLVCSGPSTGEPARITPLGRRMLDLPVHPRLARLLLAAADCGRLARGGRGRGLALGEGHPDAGCRARPRGDRTSLGRATTAASDVLVRLDLLAEAEAARFSPSLEGPRHRPGRRPPGRPVPRRAAPSWSAAVARRRMAPARTRHRPDDDDAILKWLLLAYPDRVVKRRGAEGTGVMVGGRGVRLAPESVVRDAELYLALDAREERRAGVARSRSSSPAPSAPEWLEELHPGPAEAREGDGLRRLAPARRRRDQVWYQDLLLREDVTSDLRPRGGRPGAGRRAPTTRLASPATANERVADWLARVEFLRRSVPELGWPEFDEDLLGEILEEACQGKTSIAEVERIDLVPYLQGRLDRQQVRELREGAPGVADDPERSPRPTGLRGGPAAGARRAAPGAVRLDRDASRGPRPRPGPAAHPRSELPAGPGHRRPPELLDDDLSPGPQGPPRPISQACLAR